MKRRTKTQRLQMIVREYERRHPGPFAMNDVALWGMRVGLLPAPGRLTEEIEDAEAWDNRFESIAAETV